MNMDQSCPYICEFSPPGLIPPNWNCQKVWCLECSHLTETIFSIYLGLGCQRGKCFLCGLEALWSNPTPSQMALLTLTLESESWSAPSLVGNDFPSSLYLVNFIPVSFSFSLNLLGKLFLTCCLHTIYSSWSKSNFIFFVPWSFFFCLFFHQCPYISFLWLITYQSYSKLMSISSLLPSPPPLCSKKI